MKKFFKFGCGGLIALLVIFIVLVVVIGGNESEKNKENTNNDVDKTEADVTEVDVNVKDAEIYKNEIVVHLDAFQDEYDKHWTNNWVPTFEGVSNGTVDAYKAYETLNSLEKYYTGLGNKIRNTDLPKLSKENQKLLKNYLSDLQSAILTRSRAASEAADMFDKGEFKPSEMEKIQSTVVYADQEVVSALVERTTLEQKLGLVE
ncbi:hypothetical protein ABIA69_003340 [Lysinibacillus parviboronicapiens]|uniref:Uncharacterized protein n=1 Tax=Lysinibacillus parviboronicapiens TaxID=436516 RepID=A0ABV2PMH3_9BACI